VVGGQIREGVGKGYCGLWICGVTANVSCFIVRIVPPLPLEVVVGSPFLSFLNGDCSVRKIHPVFLIRLNMRFLDCKFQ